MRQVQEDADTPAPPAAEDPEAEAKAKLRVEVAGWVLPVVPEEVGYILAHHTAERARAILWRARHASLDTDGGRGGGLT